jgi:hypothetical protein
MARLDIVQGDTAVVRIAVTNPDGTPLDLTDLGITFTIKRSNMDSDAAAVFQGTLSGGEVIVVGDEEDGIIDVVISHDSSVTMRRGRPYYWDVQLEGSTDIVDEGIFTPCFGTIYASGETTSSVNI